MKKFVKKIILKLFSFTFALGVFMPMVKATGNVERIYDPKILGSSYEAFLRGELCDVVAGHLYLPQGEEYVRRLIRTCIEKKGCILRVVDLRGKDYVSRKTPDTCGRPICLYYLWN